MEIVKKEASTISYTTDAWTSLNDDAYLGVSIIGLDIKL